MGSPVKKKKHPKKDYAPPFENAFELFEEKGDALLDNIIYRIIEYRNTYRSKKRKLLTLNDDTE